MIPNPRARALDLAVPVASCIGAGIRAAHLLDGLSRDELVALTEVLALAASSDPARLRAVVSGADGMTAPMVSRVVLLRKAHAAAAQLRGAGQPVPPRLRLLDSEYRRERKPVPPRQPEPCGTPAAYRRHKRRGEDGEKCGCAAAARREWAARKRAQRAGEVCDAA